MIICDIFGFKKDDKYWLCCSYGEVFDRYWFSSKGKMLNKGNGYMKMCINMYCFLIIVFIFGCNVIINYYNEYLYCKGMNLFWRYICSKSLWIFMINLIVLNIIWYYNSWNCGLKNFKILNV